MMRRTISSSVRVVPISFGPLPASRPPPLWHQPQVLANSFSTSNVVFEAAEGAVSVADVAAVSGFFVEDIGPFISAARTAPYKNESATVAKITRRRDTTFTRSPKWPEKNGRRPAPRPD